ncbi:phytanoyl-CoA dioxygenase family protein [Novosphingobium rosa]|uniref:phytanoyl-CoA dioxygenase family protein n=1 Tax=Novosphingobium rosa TaxID=76978 RepID=UPI000830DB33|nr:phytanoyl-CoA dioxygenase family protein [Novosphingobium rosa]
MINQAALARSIAQSAAALQSQGYCVIKNAVAPGLIHDLERDLEPDFHETPFGQGGFYGSTTKRFGRLLIRSQITQRLVQHLTVMGVVEHMLLPWCDRIQLNTTQAIEIHPGAPAQMPHRDQDMWRGPIGEVEYLVNVMWPITRFTTDNGATLIWPRTHGREALEAEPRTSPIAIEMEAGSALLFLGSTLHGAGANRTSRVRRGLVIGYALGWLKPYENQWLAYPPEIAKTFSPELAALVGYRQHRPNLGNYEGRCPSVLLRSHMPRRLGAIDALRPDQEQQIEAYLKEQVQSAEQDQP